MLKRNKIILSLLAVLIMGSLQLSAQDDPPKVGIQDKLGDKIPLELTFFDSDSNEVQLKDIVDRPIVLALVYYHCPGICTPLLTELARVMDLAKIEPGKDYRAVALSFDPNEGPSVAKKWKKEHYTSVDRPLDKGDWLFLTGNEENIRKLTEACGFYYQPAGEEDFTHSGGLIILSPEGKIVRYLKGIEFMPFDLKMSVIEASKGNEMPALNRVLQVCFSYDPEGKTYVFNFTKVFGTIFMTAIGIFFIVLVVKGRKKRKGEEEESEEDEKEENK